MFRKNVLFLFVLLTFSSYSQIERKTLKATRIQDSPKIDGVLDDPIWDSLPAHGDFFMFEPGNTEKERDTHRTEVKLAYDDKAIYIAAYLFDNEPQRILRQFSQRDQVFVQADFFSVNINTLDDGINETVFYVTSAGTIGDSRKENNGEDFNFNVVFQCNTSLDDKGWYAEFKIPYNALRFPELEVQNWSINFFRRINHLNETYTWNHINRQVGFATQYSGEITNLTNIDPPLRLILFPFVQGAVFAGEDATETDFSAGMDIKYGLSDNFTLDATLIPDFGQAAFDNVELNLGPFEQVFSENRQFFTEGIELFERGGLFFSRRVGSRPTRRGRADDNLTDSEKVIENPENVNLINAVKVSGRTQGNLGIGFFNSITEPTKAIIRDTVTGATREVTTESLANYNIVVLDQQFNRNSSVSFINTNVTRSGDFRDANVTGLIYNISNRANSYNYEGGVRLSSVKDGTTQTGIRTNFEIRKTKGNLRWFLGHFMADQNYDPNDLGLLFRNNFNNFAGRISYQIFQPRGIFNEYRITLRANHRRLFRPSVTTRNSLSVDAFFVTPERFAFGGDIGYNGRDNDYFEPRVEGRFVTFSSNLGGRAWVSSDYRKKFAYDVDFTYRNWFEDPQTRYSFSLSPRYRFSDKFLLIWNSEFSRSDREFGYIDDDDTDVFLGERDVISLENSLRASFNFDSYKALNLRFRNFWSTANYEDDAYFVLNDDGSRSPTNFDISENNPNTNFNIWNIDLSFNWRFSPGSEAILLYRNSIFNEDDSSDLNYLDSLGNLFQQNINHTLSLRIVYFLDINNIGASFKG
ncbi:DUF5916 domain-containing protein [Ascidiimonas aurantiaca]|uniref:DUF5916 domain-containing protein n=1 Tax=Ascidiimonas aurantiaca TaxID=1685432 RepID=UPI0030EB3E73